MMIGENAAHSGFANNSSTRSISAFDRPPDFTSRPRNWRIDNSNQRAPGGTPFHDKNSRQLANQVKPARDREAGAYAENPSEGQAEKLSLFNERLFQSRSCNKQLFLA